MLKSLVWLTVSGSMLLVVEIACGADTGCGGKHDCAPVCWFHHCKHCCECQCPEREAPRAAPVAPRAAIVESMPVFQMTPGVIAMPMMMAARQATFEQPREQTCSTSKDRLDALETTVSALDLRMRTIQRSVEIQTRILEEMKAEGRFPQRYLPPGGVVTP